MKKLSLILLALLLCLSTACAQTLPAKDPAPVDTSEPSAAPAAEPTAEPTVEPTAEPTAEPIPEETMPLGAVSGTEYTNEYFGLKLTLPSTSWIFYNQEQLNALNGSTQAILEKADLDAFLEKAGSLIIASGSDLTTGNSCTLSLTPSAGVGALMTPALLKLSMENAVEPLRQSFVSMGYTVDSVQVETAQLMGKTVPCIHLSASANGSSLFETIVMVPGTDYLLSISMATVGENLSDSLLDMVTSLD